MVELPDTSDLIIGEKEVINWEMIHGRYLLLTPSEFGNGSGPRIAKILGVPRTSLERHRKAINPGNKKTWDQEREEVHKDVSEKVLGNIVQSIAAQKIELITQAKERKKKLDVKIDLFLDSEDFTVNEENLKHLLEISEKIAQGIGKLAGITDTGGSKSINFTLNVPPKFLTMEGRRWVERQMNNPSDVIDGEFKEIKNEDEMQKKLENKK